MSSQALQVGDRLVVVPRSGTLASAQLSGRVLAAKENNLVRISWDLDGRNPFKKGDEFLIIGRDLRRRGIYLNGDEQSANLVLRETAGDGRSNRRFARVESSIRFSWRRVSASEVDGLEFKIRDAVGVRQRVTTEAVSAPKTQLGDYLEQRLRVVEELLRQVLERLETSDPAATGMIEGLVDLSGSGMVFPVDNDGFRVAVAFTAISPPDQEAIVRYNFQIERSRRRAAVDSDIAESAEQLADEPAADGAASPPLTGCAVAVGDHVEVCFSLPLEVPTEIRAMARVVRVEAG
jgi:hypothetical protein